MQYLPLTITLCVHERECGVCAFMHACVRFVCVCVCVCVCVFNLNTAGI